MSPANVPSTNDQSLKSRRKGGKKNWKESAGLKGDATDWPLVARALVSSVVTTVIWVLVGAEIIFFATRPFPGSRENPKGHLEYYFPDDMARAPYYICSVPGKDPETGKTTCPYNGWTPRKSDGRRGAGVVERTVEFAAEMAALANGLSKAVEPGAKVDGSVTQSTRQRGGSGDFYSCTRGSVNLDDNLPEPPKGPSFPYAYAGGKDDLLNKGWGTASPMTALAYMVAQTFITCRGSVKAVFEELRPVVAGGGVAQGVVMLASGLVTTFGWLALAIAYVIMILVIAFRAIVGHSTNYVGPHDEVHDMALKSRCKYWAAWVASYLVPVTLAIWGAPLIAGLTMVKLVFDTVVAPLRTPGSRATMMRILSCNAPWVMVIFGGVFLLSSSGVMNGHEWLGMGLVYSALTFYTLRKWHARVD